MFENNSMSVTNSSNTTGSSTNDESGYSANHTTISGVSTTPAD